MIPVHSDAALIDNASHAIHELRARIDDDVGRIRSTESLDENRAIHCCLTSAISLLDVSRTLILKPAEPTPLETVRHWDALVRQTKAAGRAAYEAALILADGRHAA
jgi:hypothetical protein